MCILCLDSPICTPTEPPSIFKDDPLFQYLKVKCECAICLERMVDAKTLKCQHSFCKDCLDDVITIEEGNIVSISCPCLLYTSPSPRDKRQSRMPSSA